MSPVCPNRTCLQAQAGRSNRSCEAVIFQPGYAPARSQRLRMPFPGCACPFCRWRFATCSVAASAYPKDVGVGLGSVLQMDFAFNPAGQVWLWLGEAKRQAQCRTFMLMLLQHQGLMNLTCCLRFQLSPIVSPRHKNTQERL